MDSPAPEFLLNDAESVNDRYIFQQLPTFTMMANCTIDDLKMEGIFIRVWDPTDYNFIDQLAREIEYAGGYRLEVTKVHENNDLSGSAHMVA